MSLRSAFVRIKHAIFGKPLTHEEAQALQRTDLGNHRNGAESDARGRSVQNQTWWGA
ncbi:hypothetical protein [Microbacterium sp. CFBP9034]|uniref:hypothetical protein n=1 Tax=Microbacterium sp. CFBP9034 TaxID=3096540 RepID=UPI002A69F254|nr:hypothetical protein [Microbacterium sp. CFBP9034]MDY0908745.1 hypothetical protein [Microbacterium sp. CFBP9034]